MWVFSLVDQVHLFGELDADWDLRGIGHLLAKLQNTNEYKVFAASRTASGLQEFTHRRTG